MHLVDLETSDCMFFWGRLTVGVTPAPQIFTQSFFEKKTPRKEERFQQLGNYMKKWRKRVQNR